MDAVLEEGAANLEELKVIWGDPDEPLDFEGFSAVPNTPSFPGFAKPSCSFSSFQEAQRSKETADKPWKVGGTMTC